MTRYDEFEQQSEDGEYEFRPLDLKTSLIVGTLGVALYFGIIYCADKLNERKDDIKPNLVNLVETNTFLKGGNR
ncbi:MAG: hypothetical protein WCK29_00345 [archaeon]